MKESATDVNVSIDGGPRAIRKTNGESRARGLLVLSGTRVISQIEQALVLETQGRPPLPMPRNAVCLCIARDAARHRTVSEREPAVRDRVTTVLLREALASLPAQSLPQAQEELQTRVNDFVDMAKAEGWPVERVIVAIKQVAADAGVRGSTDVLRARGALREQDALLLNVVRWSVERYYDYSRRSGPSTPRG